MIVITHSNIDDIVNEHYKKVKSIINNNRIRQSFLFFKDIYNGDFEFLIKARPVELNKMLYKYEKNNYNKAKFIFAKKIIKNHYTKFINKFGSDFINNLEITVCPYCNREYIFKFEDTKKQKARVLATFDHFYDKSRYPFLSLSFYNLIPSCSICNSKFKTTKDFYEEKHLHPYEDDFNSRAKFHLKIVKPSFYHSTKGIRIELKENDNEDIKTKNTISTFRLNDIYEKHSDIALELIKKQYMYSDDYLETLYKQYEGTLFKNFEQLKGIIFGNYISDDEVHKRPLAKFTKDILEDLE
ncbi:MAG: hypothetical protein GXO80_00140 [Chlorobi bacterium]|nr:hypothetical protein [Chlorobiota bacterium]